MPGAQAFSTIAEIGIAFLGFTGVVGVFGGRGQPAAVSLRLWVMVEFGLGLLLLALLPIVLHHLGWAGPALWGACSGAALLFLLGHAVLVVPRVGRYMRTGEWGGVPVLNLSFPAAYSLCFATQALNLIGVGLERSIGGYLLGLFLLLGASGLNFISLLVALRSSKSEQV